MVESFVRFLAVRVADQRQVIANLVTLDSKPRPGRSAQAAMKFPKTVHYQTAIPREFKYAISITRRIPWLRITRKSRTDCCGSQRRLAEVEDREQEYFIDTKPGKKPEVKDGDTKSEKG